MDQLNKSLKRQGDEDLRQKLNSRLTVPLWPDTGRALNRGKRAIYDGARRGEIPVIGKRNRMVPTAWIRRTLGLEREAVW